MELHEKIKEVNGKMREMEQSFPYLSRYINIYELIFKFDKEAEERKKCVEYANLKKEVGLLISNNNDEIKEVIASESCNEDRIGVGDYVEYDGYVGAASHLKYRKDDILKDNKYVEFEGFNVERGDYRIVCELEKDVKLLMKCPLKVTKRTREKSIDFLY